MGPFFFVAGLSSLLDFSCSFIAFLFSFLMISRMGRYAAAMHMLFRSDPEKPPVTSSRPRRAQSNPGASASSASVARRMRARSAASGMSTSRRRGNRRSTASSRSKGRLVTPSTVTRSDGLLRRPSQAAMNSFLILRIASCSPLFSRRPSMLSTSSMNTMAGAILEASVNTARTYFSPSPNHFEATLLMVRCRKCAPASVASAFASIVLPVPGGP
mmetsp:Transcript_42495/g.69811  ORF Transcript_42495/g.69811 Transcript_42495/m.69811 type:complete len:215 (+) Transcript_42495:605-1249(+)